MDTTTTDTTTPDTTTTDTITADNTTTTDTITADNTTTTDNTSLTTTDIFYKTNKSAVRLNEAISIPVNFLITGFIIDSLTVNIPLSRAELLVRIIFNNGKFSETYHLVMSPEIYSQWGTDDSFITTFITGKINDLLGV